jgi:small nuclear ribonucleoprotein (snRNP)-like protein
MSSNKLFQADTQLVSMIQNMKETVQSICKQHTRQKVRIEAIDGRVYEGQIVNCDNQHVYLEVEEEVDERPKFVPVSGRYPYSPCPPVSYSKFSPYGETYAPYVGPETYEPYAEPETYAPYAEPEPYGPFVEPETYAPYADMCPPYPEAYAPIAPVTPVVPVVPVVPHPPIAPYPFTPWYPYPGYNPYVSELEPLQADSPDSSVNHAPRRRRRRRKIIPLALYTLLNIILL